MIQSDLIDDILDLSIEGLKYEDKLFQQAEILTIEKIDYTGIGLYAYFRLPHQIFQYRLTEDELRSLFGKNNPMIETVRVVNKSLEI
ncbi:MAG: hypothetical protein HRT57_05235, partial [Crocinitomicaceae bacterium]|nr:hypothetical protein [Crocinitomicaceae bacterium]